MTKPVTRALAVKCLIDMAYNGELISWTNYEIGSGNDFDTFYVFKCVECGKAIQPGEDVQFDHRHADVHGGPHDHKNIRMIHKSCHTGKTARDVRANAKVKRLAAGGRKRKGPPMKSRGFSKTSKPFPKRRKPSAST